VKEQQKIRKSLLVQNRTNQKVEKYNLRRITSRIKENDSREEERNFGGL